MSTAFVAGATGYTGREVVRGLVARGVKTIGHVRPDSPRLDEQRARIAADGAIADATPWEREALTQTFRSLRPDLIFALLGTTRARAKQAAREGGKSADYEAIDYGLTKMLLDAAISAEIKPRFVYLSSAGVSASSSMPYIAVRWRFEQELRPSGLSYAIARPGIITGPDREEHRPMEKVAQAVGDRALAFAGLLGATKLRDRYRSTDAKTLAGALIRLALDTRENRVYESEELR